MKFPVDASQRDVIKAFGKLGFVIVRKANHIILERKNKDGSITPLVLPNHRTIKGSTLRSILTQSGIERNEFIKAFYD
ncbi:MAG: type II toxin-antitoxin system HicA family toxin [Ignavibacteriales bacterium]|nr:type II toxin-antitoxin system HicA family toxin [Ignavibacteriales bacterium]